MNAEVDRNLTLGFTVPNQIYVFKQFQQHTKSSRVLLKILTNYSLFPDNDAGIEFNESGNSSRHLETTKDKSPPLDHSLVKRTPLGNKSPGTSRFSADKLCEQAKNRFRRSCTTKQLYRRLPFLQWIPKYTFDSAFYDCMAGVTVALTAIPQGIAYGAVAGVPVEVELYSENQILERIETHIISI